MGSTAAATFNGTSKYADDLQQALNRAVSIAALPLQQLNNNVNNLQSQSTELGTLQSKFSALQTAIKSLSTATSGSGLQPFVSNDSVASATLDSSGSVGAGSYDLNVVSVGLPTITLSSSTLPIVADPTATSISASANYVLTYNGLTFVVAPAANNLNSLAQAINASGAPVSATVINIGPPSAPDYRLSLQSKDLGNETIQLNDGTNNLLDTLSTGSPAQYQVNGLPSTPISTSSATVNIAPGLTVTLRNPGETQIDVQPDSSGTTDAISAVVAAYNAAATELATNHGSAGGALTGSSAVFQLEQALRSLTGFTGGSGTVTHLSDIGITFNSTSGQLSFDQNVFNAAQANHPDDVAAFLGTAGGSGFLATATNALTQASTNTIQTGLDSLSKQINDGNTQIADAQDRLIKLNNDLVAQMSAADAAISSLDSQLTFFTQLFQQTSDVLKNS